VFGCVFWLIAPAYQNDFFQKLQACGVIRELSYICFISFKLDGFDDHGVQPFKKLLDEEFGGDAGHKRFVQVLYRGQYFRRLNSGCRVPGHGGREPGCQGSVSLVHPADGPVFDVLAAHVLRFFEAAQVWGVGFRGFLCHVLLGKLVRRSFGFAQDFACGLGRPQNGSSW
jgi:hypothetical protein